MKTIVWHLVFVAALSISVSGSAQAYINAPVLTPQPLSPDQPVEVTVAWGDFHLLAEHPVDPTLFPRVITNGQTIRVEVFGMDYSNWSPSLYSPPAESTFPIGPFPAGNYTLELVLASPVPDGFEYRTLHTVPMIIRGSGAGAAVTLPVGGFGWTLLMLLMLAVAGGLVIRSRAHT